MVLNNVRSRIQSRHSSAIQHHSGDDFTVARALGGSTAGLQGMGSAQTSQHQEQLRHNRGYTYAIVRTIASRIAGQRLRVALVDDHREETYGDHTVQQASRRRDRGYSKRRAVRRGKALIPGVQSRDGVGKFYIKHRAPEFVKDFLQQPNAEIIEDHPLCEAFDNPNEIMTGWVMRFVTVGSIELTGKAYWLILRADESETGKDEIWPLPSSWVTPIHTEEKLYKEYRVLPIGIGVPFVVPAQNMAYFYCPDPADPLGAVSPLQAAANAVSADEAIEISNTKTFTNGCNPGLAVTIGRASDEGATSPDDRPILSDPQRRQLIETIKAHYRGVLNNDEPLILDGRIRDVKRITTNPREMDFLNSAKATKARLAQMWGVPLTVMGEIENQSRASSAVADDHFLANVVNPRIEMISQVLTKVAPMIWDDGRKTVVYIEKGVSQDADLDLKVEDMLLKNAAISRNEVRANHGMEPIKDGDSCFFGGIEIPILKDDQHEEDGDYKGDIFLPGFVQKKRHRPIQGRPLKGTIASYIGEGAQVNLWARQMMQMEYLFQRDLHGFFIKMGEEIKTHLTPNIKGIVVVSDSMVTEVLHSVKWEEMFKQQCQPHIQKLATTGAMIEWAMHSRKYHPDLVQKGLFDAMSGLPRVITGKVAGFVQGLFSMDYWGGVVETIKGSILDGLGEARDNGDTGRRAADHAVDKALGGNAAARRSQNISSTETITAINGGGNESRKHLAQIGAVRQKKWWTVGDEKVRKSHQDANGQIVGIDDKFILESEKGGRYECDFPGDPSLPGDLRCRCRCTVISIG